MKKQLPDVTLIAISSIKIPETMQVLQKCCQKLEFASVKIVTHERPKKLSTNIVYEYCPLIDNIHKYNQYAFSELGKHIDTSHCLLIQYDSGVLRPELWNDGWLQYDYIGAPWPYSDDAYIAPSGGHVRVGNGGFSLRSKKLLDLPKNHNIKLTHDRGYWNEDGNICVYHREKFLDLGINYAPVAVAAVFSHENDVPENENILPFGFHKYAK
jgi:hypothetical protein